METKDNSKGVIYLMLFELAAAIWAIGDGFESAALTITSENTLVAVCLYRNIHLYCHVSDVCPFLHKPEPFCQFADTSAFAGDSAGNYDCCFYESAYTIFSG